MRLPEVLSPRVQETLVLMLRGFNAKTIAREMNVAPNTIKVYIKTVLETFHCDTHAQFLARHLCGKDHDPKLWTFLTAAERKVVDGLHRGLATKQIAHDIGRQPGTVKVHLKRVYFKCSVSGQKELLLRMYPPPVRTEDVTGLPEYVGS